MQGEGVSPVPREARAYQGRHAGVVTRLVAACLDGLVVVLMLAVLYAGWAAILFLVSPRRFGFPTPSVFFSFSSGFVVAVVYLTLTWWLSGRSYGDLVMGLRVLGPGGRPLRIWRALLRALTCALVPIGLLGVAVSAENRSLQDWLLHTSVVYDWQGRGQHPDMATEGGAA